MSPQASATILPARAASAGESQVRVPSAWGMGSRYRRMTLSFELLEFPQTVPEGCVFVLGDNRAVSEDSRYLDVGMIDTRNILGKAVFHLLPLKSLGPVK